LEEQIKFELFTESQQGRLAKQEMEKRAEGAKGTELTVIIEGAQRSFEMSKGQSVLEAALENGQDAPFSCKAGVCSTCMCKVLEGEVEMISNHALEDYEVERGYVLSCQSYPLTDRLVIDYDTH
jgi:ring-1,2-phenylacetyl-CoA epoxidase subunit PaaE